MEEESWTGMAPLSFGMDCEYGLVLLIFCDIIACLLRWFCGTYIIEAQGGR